MRTSQSTTLSSIIILVGKTAQEIFELEKFRGPIFLKMITNASTQPPENPPGDTLKYRILTGTYSTRKAAESVLDVMKKTLWLGSLY